MYASELGQHHENDAQRLTDRLDDINTYVVATRHGRVSGFIAITPPTESGYSIDKYFTRMDVPVTFDNGLFEVRLLTVIPEARHTPLAALLMLAAFRYCESHAAHTIVAIGRVELLELYQRAGLRALGRRVTSGRVTYELPLCRDHAPSTCVTGGRFIDSKNGAGGDMGARGNRPQGGRGLLPRRRLLRRNR